MSQVYLVRTNQKLNFARIHIDALQAAQSSNSWDQHAMIDSYDESVLFLMASAYQAFLREIAEKYRFNPDAIEALSDLQGLLDASVQESPEVTELSVLESNKHSWLALMLSAYRGCWKAADKTGPSAKAKVGADLSPSLSEIHIVQINPDHAEDADILTEYRSWLSEFRALLERLRSGMQEW